MKLLISISPVELLFTGESYIAILSCVGRKGAFMVLNVILLKLMSEFRKSTLTEYGKEKFICIAIIRDMRISFLSRCFFFYVIFIIILLLFIYW